MQYTDNGCVQINDVAFEMNDKKFAGTFTIEYDVDVWEQHYNHNCCVDDDSADEFECTCTGWTIKDWEIWDSDENEVDGFKYEDIKAILKAKMNVEDVCADDYAEHGSSS